MWGPQSSAVFRSEGRGCSLSSEEVTDSLPTQSSAPPGPGSGAKTPDARTRTPTCPAVGSAGAAAGATAVATPSPAIRGVAQARGTHRA